MISSDESVRPAGNTRGITVTGACVQGERHIRTGEPCQDAFFWSPIPGGVVTAIADGLSSAVHAETGARIAVERVCRAVVSSYGVQSDPDQNDLIRHAIREARRGVIEEAERAGARPSLYGSTLIVAILGNGTLTVGHIGDGIAAGVQKGTTLIISGPGESEYANETACLTQHDWESFLRITEAVHIEALILATDGCQGAIAIRKNGDLNPYDPFILPLVSFIRKKTESGIDPAPDITGLLTSIRMRELSGDDKTLVILLGPDPAQTQI